MGVPRSARSQKIHRIGVLGVASPTGYARQVEAFRRGLRELGHAEGKTVSIEYRWANGDIARLPELAAELVRLNPDVLVTSGPGSAIAKRTTTTIPIVMAVSTNAVESGLVASLARPGGNVTGSSSVARELTAKRLELLKEVVPQLSRVGVLLPPGSAANPAPLHAMAAAARSLKLRLLPVEARDTPDLERAFAALGDAKAEALLVTEHTMFVAEAARIAHLATVNRLPAIGFVEIADHGGLMAYGVDFPVLWHRAASFVDRILKGARPADLPVEQPTKFELVVNLRAARSLGLALPGPVRVRADRVIE